MNILLIGDSHTGKSAFINRLLHDRYTESYITTIGKDLYHHCYQGKKIFLHDCGGGDRYYHMIELYFNIGDGFMIFYTDKSKNIEKWTGMVPKGKPFILVKNGGTKDKLCDIHIDCKKNKNISSPLSLICKKIPEKKIQEESFIYSIFEYFLSFLNF